MLTSPPYFIGGIPPPPFGMPGSVPAGMIPRKYFLISYPASTPLPSPYPTLNTKANTSSHPPAPTGRPGSVPQVPTLPNGLPFPPPGPLPNGMTFPPLPNGMTFPPPGANGMPPLPPNFQFPLPQAGAGGPAGFPPGGPPGPPGPAQQPSLPFQQPQGGPGGGNAYSDRR